MGDENKLQEIFDSMPTNTECAFMFNGDYHLFHIPWSQKGRGFGEYCFFVGEDRKLHLDNESDLPETIKKVMDELVDNHPEKVKKMFHQMVDMCELTDPPEDSMKTLEKMKDNES